MSRKRVPNSRWQSEANRKDPSEANSGTCELGRFSSFSYAITHKSRVCCRSGRSGELTAPLCTPQTSRSLHFRDLTFLENNFSFSWFQIFKMNIFLCFLFRVFDMIWKRNYIKITIYMDIHVYAWLVLTKWNLFIIFDEMKFCKLIDFDLLVWENIKLNILFIEYCPAKKTIKSFYQRFMSI